MLPWYSCSSGPNNRKHEGSGGETGAREAAQIFVYVEAINPPNPLAATCSVVVINEVIFSYLNTLRAGTTAGLLHAGGILLFCSADPLNICQAGQGEIF